MKKITAAIIAIVVLLIITALWQAEWEQVTDDIGLSREARQHPWLAADKLLNLHNKKLTADLEISQVANIGQQLLDPDAAVLINEANFAYHPGLDSQLLNWVEEGGHMLYELSAAHNNSDVDNALLQHLPVEINRDAVNAVSPQLFMRLSASNTRITLPSGDYSAYILPAVEMDSCPDAGVIAKQTDSDTLLLCQYKVGQGKITFASSFSFMQNILLDKHQHGALMLTLLQENHALLQFKTPYAEPWLLQLWRWNPPLIMLLLMTLVLALWRLAQRFGPAQPVIARQNLSYHLHLQALSEYLQAHADKTQLQQELIKDLYASYEKRFPGFLQWAQTQQHLVIARESGIPEQEIQHLLQAQWPQHEHDRQRYLQLWQQLRNSK